MHITLHFTLLMSTKLGKSVGSILPPCLIHYTQWKCPHNRKDLGFSPLSCVLSPPHAILLRLSLALRSRDHFKASRCTQFEKVGHSRRLWVNIQFKLALNNHISKKAIFLGVHKQICKLKKYFTMLLKSIFLLCILPSNMYKLHTAISR